MLKNHDVEKLAKNSIHFFLENSLDEGIQDRSTSISIMYEIEEMSHEGEDDESDKRIHISTRS